MKFRTTKKTGKETAHMDQTKSFYEQFIESSQNGELLQQEELILQVTELLAEVMHLRGVNRAELAEKIGKSKAFVSQILRGNQNMTLKTLASLFFALDYKLNVKAIPIHFAFEKTYPMTDWDINYSAESCTGVELSVAQNKKYVKTSDPKLLEMLGAA